MNNKDLYIHLSRLVGNPTMWFPNRSDTNRPVQAQKRARSLKFRIYVEEELYYPCSENKDADQLRGYREADLRLCFRLWFSHETAHFLLYNLEKLQRSSQSEHNAIANEQAQNCLTRMLYVCYLSILAPPIRYSLCSKS